MKKSTQAEIIFFGKSYKLVDPALKELALKNDRQTLAVELDKSIDNFKKFLKDIDLIWKRKLRAHIKKKAYRHWVKACIKRGLHKMKLAKKIIKRGRELSSDKKLLECIDIAILSVNFAQRVFDYNKTSSIFFGKKFQDHIIPLEEIKKGDIIVSYKTNSYLKSHLLSKLIAYATFSKITHTEFVSEKRKSKIKILACRPETNGVREITYELRPGELAFIFRPNIDKAKRGKLLNKIDEFIDLSQKNPSEYKFSESKCWTACFLGLLYTRGILFGSRNLIFQNPIHYTKGYFCSEIIEEIFYSMGIYLTPRSDCRSTVGPSEIFHSPYLKYKGIFCLLGPDTISKEHFDF